MIRLKNVSKIYNSNLEALHEVDLDIEEGDIFGIVGKSGAGKTTMLKLIGMLEQPSSGEIQILGQNVEKMNAAGLTNIRKNLGTVFQGFNLLLQRNIEQNIAFGMEIAKKDKKEIKKRCEELAKLVGLEDKLKAYPVQLSGGQKQRVAIARALATNPKILLCDEPTSALDSFTTKEILKLLKDINKKLNITIVIITHEIGVVKAICNKMVVIDGGMAVEVGDTKEILADPQHEATKMILSLDNYIID